MTDRMTRFDRLYHANIDPWGFRTSAYEHQKYRATLAALPRSDYALGIEAGCSIGELTRLLADCCARMIGIDVSGVALEEAARRNADRKNVRFIKGELPGAWPQAAADLIVLSEVLYFLTPDEITQLAQRICGRWRKNGVCVVVNYLGPTAELLQGAQSAQHFITAMPIACPVSRMVGQGYQIDTLVHV